MVVDPALKSIVESYNRAFTNVNETLDVLTASLEAQNKMFRDLQTEVRELRDKVVSLQRETNDLKEVTDDLDHEHCTCSGVKQRYTEQCKECVQRENERLNEEADRAFMTELAHKDREGH